MNPTPEKKEDRTEKVINTDKNLINGLAFLFCQLKLSKLLKTWIFSLTRIYT